MSAPIAIEEPAEFWKGMLEVICEAPLPARITLPFIGRLTQAITTPPATDAAPPVDKPEIN